MFLNIFVDYVNVKEFIKEYLWRFYFVEYGRLGYLESFLEYVKSINFWLKFYSNKIK